MSDVNQADILLDKSHHKKKNLTRIPKYLVLIQILWSNKL